MVSLPRLPFGRKEDAILRGIQEHLALVHSTTRLLFDLIDAVSARDERRASEIVEAVLEGESKADGLQRSLSLRIAEGAFFGGVREDILNLIEKIDNIADSAKDASRLLNITGARSPEGLKILRSENMKAFTGDLDAAITALAALVEAFHVNKKAVLSQVHTVEEHEEAADTHKDALLKELFGDRDRVDPVTMIQLRDFIFEADDIADNAEDASDVIIVLVAKGYG